MTSRSGGCSICGRPIRARGWCGTHYQRWQMTGDPNGSRFKPRGECSIDGCSSPHRARGWCGTHYQRWQATYDPTTSPSQVVDEIAVERAVRGEPPEALTRAERYLAVDQLTRWKVPGTVISERTGVPLGSIYNMQRRLTRQTGAAD